MNAFLQSLCGLLLLAASVGHAFSQTGTEAQRAKELNALAMQHASRGEFQSALDSFSRSLELQPEQPGVFISRALVFVSLQEWENAEADCTAAIELDDENAMAFQQRALARSAMNQHEEAFRDASRAVRMDPEDANAVFTRYLTACRLGRYEVGHFAGESYIGLRSWADPWSAYIALLNHVSLRRSGYNDESTIILDEAAQWLNLGVWPGPIIQFLRGEATAEALLELAKDDDARTVARYYIGVAEWLAGNNDAARKQFTWIRENGNQTFLQYLLAGDHLKEIEAGIKPSPATN